MLRKDAECWTNTCSFAGVYQPRLGEISFIAWSGFVKTVVKQLKLPWDVSLMTLGRVTKKLCSMTLHELKAQYSNVSTKTLVHFCFNSRYMFILLRHGYNMDLLGTRILFLQQIGGVHIGWPLGSTIYEINAMPWDIENCPDAPGATSYARESANPPAVPFRDTIIETEPSLDSPNMGGGPTSGSMALAMPIKISQSNEISYSSFFTFGTLLACGCFAIWLVVENRYLKSELATSRQGIELKKSYGTFGRATQI